MKIILGLACLLLFSLANSVGAAASVHYTVADLGVTPHPLPGERISNVFADGLPIALRLGADGQVAGVFNPASSKPARFTVFKWRCGHLHLLGMIPGVSLRRSDGGIQPYAINIKAEVAGVTLRDQFVRGYYNPLEWNENVFLWRNGKMRLLPKPSRVNLLENIKINDRELIAGEMGFPEQGGEASRAFRSQNGKMHLLGRIPNFRRDLGDLEQRLNFTVTGINTNGQIAGTESAMVDADTGQSEAFLYSHGKTHGVGAITGYPTDTALALNDRGEVLISGLDSIYEPPVSFHGAEFIWNGRRVRPVSGSHILTLDNFVGTMNASEQVLGYSDNADGKTRHDFVYHNGQRQALDGLVAPNSGWAYLKACDINDAGQIVGYGKHNRKDSVFLLTPVHQAKS